MEYFLLFLLSVIECARRGWAHRVISAHLYLEGDGQSLVAAPVCGQHRAQEVGTVGAHELSRVLREDLHAAVTHAQFPAAALVRSDRRQSVAHLPRAQAGGGRCEAAVRGLV